MERQRDCVLPTLGKAVHARGADFLIAVPKISLFLGHAAFILAKVIPVRSVVRCSESKPL